jgi:hypothetical protein
MGPLLVGLLLARGQGQPVPKGKNAGAQLTQDQEFAKAKALANNKFRKLMTDAKTLSVDFEVHQAGNPVPGHGNLTLVKPYKLYYHLVWGPEDYTYTIHNGMATEIDKNNKVYDEYGVPGWFAPEANGSDWMSSYFPAVFISDQVLLPPNCFDASGHVAKYGIASGDQEAPKRNVLTFSNYKFDAAVPDSKFTVPVPAGLSAFSTPRNAPPLQIGEALPNLHLIDSSGRPQDLIRALGGKPALVALLDQHCSPSMASIPLLKETKGVPVIVLNGGGGKGLNTAPLTSYFDPAGTIPHALRAPMTPLYYLVDGTGKITNVWYGYDRDDPSKFSKQISEAVAEMHG